MTHQEILQIAQSNISPFNWQRIEPLPLAGSDRLYFRLQDQEEQIIATYSENVAESKRFIQLAQYFASMGICVPSILFANEESTLYFQSDAGNVSLLETVLKEGHTEEIKSIYKTVLNQVFQIQMAASKDDFKELFQQCATFGEEQVLFDLNYFKNNFLSKLEIPFDAQKLQGEFDAWARTVGNKEQRFFMYRDLQGRNIMLKNERCTFIDFQGGLKGHPMYDVVSLLWQAKAKIPSHWKKELLQSYLANAKKRLGDSSQFSTVGWESDYHALTLTRLLQVLGAYGLRGLVEGKEHFITSIPLGLENISEWLNENELNAFPEMERILNAITKKEFIEKF